MLAPPQPQTDARAAAKSVAAVMRRLPYPYRAMLAICSDLDETPDAATYRLIARYLNTTEPTRMGPGAGLEVGNTIYFDMPGDQFAYWTTDDAGRAMVRELIRSGHIDCLHSYGDLASRREHASRALDELNRHDCRLEVWIDHAVAPTNLGPDIMRGCGDVPGDPAYHADLTCAAGVQYVWRGRVTSVIGQNVPRRLAGLFTRREPVRSGVTVAKEIAKGLLARCGSEKYAPHAENQVLRPARLRDGRRVYEFLRSNPSRGGVSDCDTAGGIREGLRADVVERLIDREAICVFYTHLGKVRDPAEPFGPDARAAFERLGERCMDGDLLTATTRRLLGYCRAIREIEWSVSARNGAISIDIRTPQAPWAGAPLARSDLDGLTFYVQDPQRFAISVNGREEPIVWRNPPDRTGRASVSLPWRRLEFPSL